MNEIHKNKTSENLIASRDANWVFNKKSKLWIFQQGKITGFEDKTSWDKLNLFGTLFGALAIPLIIAVATFGFGWFQFHLTNIQHAQDQASALDQQRATILQTYIDNIQDLLLNHNLLQSKRNDDVAILARARTLTALKGLDPERKGYLLVFLHEANLIGFEDLHGKIDDPIILLSGDDLTGANLSGADLTGADLSEATLTGADLSGAILFQANLSGDDLSRADLSKSDIHQANLTNANLSRAYLYNTDLSGADLFNANLSKANLSQSDLSGADLFNANLSQTNLSQTNNLTQQELDQVDTCIHTILPTGIVCHHT